MLHSVKKFFKIFTDQNQDDSRQLIPFLFAYWVEKGPMQTKLKGEKFKKLKKALSRKIQFDLLDFQACCSFKIQTFFLST